MYVLKNICFVCLTDNAKNLKAVFYDETEDETCTRIDYTLPELEILNSEGPVYICTSCSITLSFFYTFKRKCLENYNRWKHYIYILQKTSDTQEQRFSELQIRLTNCKPLINQKPQQNIEMNKKDRNSERNEVPILTASGTEEQLFSDLQIKIDDNKPLLKQEPELHMVVKEGLAAEQEEIFTTKLNIKDENEDAFQSSEDQNYQKAAVEDSIEEESLASEDSAEQVLDLEPEFVNVKCEPVSDDEQDGGSSVTSIDKNAVTKGKLSSINDTDSQELKCRMCNEMCPDKSTFDNHLKNHIKKVTGLECSICKKMFIQTRYLKEHMKTHFDIKDYKCTICHKKFARPFLLNQHLKKHAIKSSEELNHQKTVVEDNIEESLASGDSADQELNQQPEFINVKCELLSDDEQDGGSSVTSMDKNAVNKGKISSMNDTDSQELKCILCNEMCSDKSTFETHVRNHINNVTGLDCLICKKTLTKSRDLKHHMKSHFNIKDHKCTICHKAYARRNELNLHLKVHAGGKDEMCKYCNKKFVYLKQHMKTHLGIKNFECTICSKKFSSRDGLRRHLQRHTGIKKHECTVCNKKFVTKAYLKEHNMKIHLGIKEYKCTICSKTFARTWEYQIHMNKHAGILNFECTICNKKYVDKSTLTKHMKFHSNIRNYECTICEKKFIESRYLKIHMESHLSYKQYECPICKKQFMHDFDVKKHIKNIHKDACSSVKKHIKKIHKDA